MRLRIALILAAFLPSLAMASPKKQPQHFTFSPGSIRGDVKVYRVPLPFPIHECEECYSSTTPKAPQTPVNIKNGYTESVKRWGKTYSSQVHDMSFKIDQGYQWIMHCYCNVMPKRGEEEGWFEASLSHMLTTATILKELSALAQFDPTKVISGSMTVKESEDQAHEYCHVVFEHIPQEEDSK